MGERDPLAVSPQHWTSPIAVPMLATTSTSSMLVPQNHPVCVLRSAHERVGAHDRAIQQNPKDCRTAGMINRTPVVIAADRLRASIQQVSWVFRS